MSMPQHPAWPAYKAALARLAEASARLERARPEDAKELALAEREFKEARKSYDAVRSRLSDHGE